MTYLDGDLYFFASPEPIYGELAGRCLAIIPHRYAPNLARLRQFGTYNVGWVGARNNPDGLAVIQWWRERCIEWCHDYVDGERFADQGYLDSFPQLFPRVKVIENIGANLAPWNIGNYRIDVRDGGVLIDADQPLVFFHFQGLRKGLALVLFNSHRAYHAPFSGDGATTSTGPMSTNSWRSRKRSIRSASSAAKPHRRSAVTDVGQYLKSKLRKLGVRCSSSWTSSPGAPFCAAWEAY